MKYLRHFVNCAVLVLAAVALTGCFPGGDNRQDEERDPHFQRGRDLVNSQEFTAAVEEFEKALDTNPRSAAAHYELGWLYDTKINDYAAAIYHYQRHLTLATNSPHAQLVHERIRGCKLELASTEFPLPNSQALQQQVFALTEDNHLLKQQLEDARNRPAATTPTPAPAPATVLPVHPESASPGPVATAPAAVAPPVASPNSAKPPAPVAGAADAKRSRTYVVQAGDNIYGIAKRYGLKANAVLAVNANISPTHLRPGQSLNLP